MGENSPKTTYRVQVDTDELIRRCVKDLQAPSNSKARVISQTAELNIQGSGVTHIEREMRTTEIQNSYESCRIYWTYQRRSVDYTSNCAGHHRAERSR
ncbi:MAG: hypothetical protein ACLSB9_33140 [Hydrogeniiclostridium mannosilyticum]